MILFKDHNGKLSQIVQKGFKKEKELQKLVEDNLNTLFGLILVQTEFSFRNRRFDSLCFDEENKSFVIIEYKNRENTSVIDQGFSYLSLLLNNKSDFLLRLSEHYGKVMKSTDIDWTSSKVIFISNRFTSLQRESINFKDIPFELWEVRGFEGGMVGLTQLINDSTESITNNIDFGDESVITQVTKEVKSYDLEHHSQNIPKDIVDLYVELDGRIMGLGDVQKKFLKTYIGYKRKSNFVDIQLTKKKLWIWVNLRKGTLDLKTYESLGIRDVSSIGRYGNGDYDFHITPDSDLDLLMSVIKKSYNFQE